MNPAQLQTALAAPLPGTAAQYSMAPGYRPGPEAMPQAPESARRAAVLILFYRGEAAQDANEAGAPEANEPHAPGDAPCRHPLHLPMMLRPDRSGPHSRQISFPGGAREAGDADLSATALRESEEELGIRPEDVRILGRLTEIYVAPSAYLVTPYVGWSDRRPDFVPDPREVDAILEIPLRHLRDPANRRDDEKVDTRYGRLPVPCFAFGEHRIWGASAMMLGELLAVLERI